MHVKRSKNGRLKTCLRDGGQAVVELKAEHRTHAHRANVTGTSMFVQFAGDTGSELFWQGAMAADDV